jgi:hypothetical protein
MVNFHSIGHMPNATPISLEFICDKSYFMASLNQALGELIAMSFHSSELWKSEVGAYEDAVLSIRPAFLTF